MASPYGVSTFDFKAEVKRRKAAGKAATFLARRRALAAKAKTPYRRWLNERYLHGLPRTETKPSGLYTGSYSQMPLEDAQAVFNAYYANDPLGRELDLLYQSPLESTFLYATNPRRYDYPGVDYGLYAKKRAKSKSKALPPEEKARRAAARKAAAAARRAASVPRNRYGAPLSMIERRHKMASRVRGPMANLMLV